MTNRELFLNFCAADAIKPGEYSKLYELLKRLKPSDIRGMDEHRQLVELIMALRQNNEDGLRTLGQNCQDTLQSLLSVGDDGMYTDPLRFLFELIQNVDDCEYDDPSAVKLQIVFFDNQIELAYNEKGFEPFNVLAITGIAEAAKNIDDSKTEIGEKGLGFKSVFGIAQSVLIQSGMFSFRLNRDHFIIPIPEYDHFTPVIGTRLTLTLKSAMDVEKICQQIKERYCQRNAIFKQNPMLFLNKLTELRLLVDNGSKQLLFTAERKQENTKALSPRLSVEHDVHIHASLQSLSKSDTHDCFQESIIGTRYTYSTEYDRAKCQDRYGINTKLRKKSMKLQIIYPDVSHLSNNQSIGTGALYSFLPTQITINAPIIIHAPFKLDGSREYVDSQNRNSWFLHTTSELLNMLNQSLSDMARIVEEQILLYLPKKHHYLFSGAKDHSLRSTDLTGEKLLNGKLFLTTDKEFHTRAEIKAYGGNLSHDKQCVIHNILQETDHLFLMPQGLNPADYGIPVLADPYHALLVQSFYKTEVMKPALPILCDWIRSASDVELSKHLDVFIPVQTAPRRSAAYIERNKPQLCLAQMELMAQYPIFAKPFCKWVQQRLLKPNSTPPFEFANIHSCNPLNITRIDPDTPFSISDVGENTREYLQHIQSKCVLVSGDCLCLPLDSALILSRKNCLDLFAKFCHEMDEGSQFDITLRLLANSKKLNDAENSLSATEFLRLLKDVRLNGKTALGNSYKNYINLLHQSGASPVRFINELLQNADDCYYPEGVIPHLRIQTTQTTFSISYNEIGFTKRNVRAITAIGESTKKLLLSGSTPSKDTIGEKGIGFKAVFSVAEEVIIHSGPFHFSLKDSAPTVPVLDIKTIPSDDTPGTRMELTLKKPLQPSLLTGESLLHLCLCLKHIKHITCNQTEITITDTENSRKISVDGTTYEYEVYRHSFCVSDSQALAERRKGDRDISPNQTVVCYVPTRNLRKPEFYLYSGLPTKIRINIPMHIDAPFELTTSRNDVLVNNWNKYILEHVYQAIYEYTDSAREKLLMRSLLYVAIKKQGNEYRNYTFESTESVVFLNAVSLLRFAQPKVYVPMVSGELHLPHNTLKYPVIIRNLITTSLSGTQIARNALNYSDSEYNAPYLYLGGQEARWEDILAVLRQANLQTALKEERFRKPFYSFLEEAKGERSLLHSLPLIPVWDTVPGSTRYVSYSEKPIYLESGKQVSSNKDYWVLNEEQMSMLQFTHITAKGIETMDHDHAVQIYKKKLLNTMKLLSLQAAYQHLLQESSTNSLFLDALRAMTATDLQMLPLKNLDGEIVDSNQIFLQSDQHVSGRMLRKYIAHPECQVFANFIGSKPLTDIQYSDVEDYAGTLSRDDLEDLLEQGAHCLRYGRSIAREFYEAGKISEKDAADYGLIFVAEILDTAAWQFPKRILRNPQSLRDSMSRQISKAPRITSQTIEKTVRGWFNPDTGNFREFSQIDGRQEQLDNYRVQENRDYCFCQMCRTAKKHTYIEVPCIQREPDIYLPQAYLSLCLECSKRFQGLRDAKRSSFSAELSSKIKNARLTGSGNVTIEMEDYDLSLTFTETHLAEIQMALPNLKASSSPWASKSEATAFSTPIPANASSDDSPDQPRIAENNEDNPPPVPPSKTAHGIPIHVAGEEEGEYSLIVFSGKLKNFTTYQTEPRYLFVFCSNKWKQLAVHLSVEDKVLFIPENIYMKHSQYIQQTQCLVMRKELARA